MPYIARTTLTRASCPGQLKPPCGIGAFETEIDCGKTRFQLIGTADILDLDLGLAGSPRQLLSEFNRGLSQTARQSSCLLFDVGSLANLVGQSSWSAARFWYAAKYPFAPAMIPLYADHVLRILAQGRAQEIFDRLRQEYDFILIDSHPVLAALGEEQLSVELTECDKALAVMKSYRKVLAYPYGDAEAIGANVERAVQRAGYEVAFTTDEAALQGRENCMSLGRVCVDDMPLDEFVWAIDHHLGR